MVKSDKESMKIFLYKNDRELLEIQKVMLDILSLLLNYSKKIESNVENT